MNNQNEPLYWIGKKVKVIIDRPLGSAHPDFPECIYLVNYGYIPETLSEADNEEIDAYVLGPAEPLKEFIGIVRAVIIRKDDEIKLVITGGEDYSKEEILKMINFQEKYHQLKLMK